MFSPVILTKLNRGGARRNLVNIINKRVRGWNKDSPSESLETTPTAKNLRTSKGEDQHMAAAVRAKLEAGNFKAALRILCSEEAPAPEDQNTIQALRNKHPGPAPNRRSPIEPSGTQDLRLSISARMMLTCSANVYPRLVRGTRWAYASAYH